MVLSGHHGLHHVLRDRVGSGRIASILQVGREISHAGSRQHFRPLELVLWGIWIIGIAWLRRRGVRRRRRGHERISGTSLGCVRMRLLRIISISSECDRIGVVRG